MKPLARLQPRPRRLACWLAASVLACAWAVLLPQAARAQVLQEQSLGHIKLQGSLSGPHVLAPDGQHMARRERVGTQERYVTLVGAQPWFDRILPGAIWVGGRLVYYALENGKTVWVDGKSRPPLLGQPTSPALAGRPWPSRDHGRYLAFSSDGQRVAWYSNGVVQPQRFNRLALVDITQPQATVLFAGYKGCDLQLVGHPASAQARWDVLHWARATADAAQVFVYGQRGGLPQLHRNGKRILSQPLASFSMSNDGSQWMAVADHSTYSQPHTSLWRNGVQIDEAQADNSQQSLHLSADGMRWAWRIIDADYLAATVRQSGRPERRLDPDPAEYLWSTDGLHEAQLRFTRDAPARAEILIDGNVVGTHAAVRGRTLQVLPGGAWHYVVDMAGGVRVHSHQGEGEVFDEVSQIIALPDGQPGYVARRGQERYLVWGQRAVLTTADDVHHLQTLAWRDGALSVTAQRADEVLLLMLKPAP